MTLQQTPAYACHIDVTANCLHAAAASKHFVYCFVFDLNGECKFIKAKHCSD